MVVKIEQKAGKIIQMKSLLMVLVFLASGTFAMAQANGGLKGPAAKNYKYWLDENKPIATKVVTSDQKPLQGPAAKNKNWHKQQEPARDSFVAVETVTARPRVIGPGAKFIRPYQFRYMRLIPRDSGGKEESITSTKEPEDSYKQ
jgi:hypothetical protein